MGATKTFCVLLLSATVFIQVQCSEKIDFKSVFHTPPRKYDDFEILERSSFEPDDFVGAKDATRCIPEKPKAIANAQVLVNFDSHKKTRCTDQCDKLREQHPFVYLLPQAHHHAPHPVQVMEYTHHYHTPQCLQFPGCYYPNPYASHVPYSKVPAKVSKSCIFNVKHEIETMVDPQEMYGLTVPSGFLVQPAEDAEEQVQKIIPVNMGDVQVPKTVTEVCECKSPTKGDEELILVGLTKPTIEGFQKVPSQVEEELILVDPIEPVPKPSGFQKILDVPNKDDEELILVDPIEPVPKPSGFQKILHVPSQVEEELILVDPIEPVVKPSGFQKILHVPSKDDEELILVDHASKIDELKEIPCEEELILVDHASKIEEPKEIPCEEELILVDHASKIEEPKEIPCEEEVILVEPSQEIESFKEISREEDEEFISVGPAEPEIESFEKVPSEKEEEIILLGPTKPAEIEGFEKVPSKAFILASPEPSKLEGPKCDEEVVLVDLANTIQKHAPSKIESFLKVSRETSISEETRRRILCTVENLVNHLVHDDVNGMQPCEKLRIAEVLTQILINLKTKGEPSAVNEESLRVFFGFIKKLQDEYSFTKVEGRAGLPTPSLPSANPATLLAELQSRLSDVEENPNKDEDFVNQYSLLLLSYLKTLQKQQKDEVKPQEEEVIALTEPPKEAREEIQKEILEEIELPLLNQYVVQLNSDREKEKPLTNEDVLNLWVDSTLKLPHEKKIKPYRGNEKQSPQEDVLKPRPDSSMKIPSEEKKIVKEVDKEKEVELQEEISAYKHILESKPVEDKEIPKPKEQVSSKKEEIIPAKPTPKAEPKPAEPKQEDPTDLTLLLKYLHLLSTNIAPVPEAEPKKVDTSLLRPSVKVEKEIQTANEEAPQFIKVDAKQKNEVVKADNSNVLKLKKEEGLPKVTEHSLAKEEIIRVDDITLKKLDQEKIPVQKEEFIRVADIANPNLPPVKHQQVVEVTKLDHKQPEDIIKVTDDVIIKQTHPQENIVRIDQAEDALLAPIKLKEDEHVAYQEVKKQDREIIRAKQINGETKAAQKKHEDIIRVDDASKRGEIIKVCDHTKPDEFLNLKKDGNVKMVEEIVKHPLLHSVPIEEVVEIQPLLKLKKDERKGEEEIIKVNEEIIKDKDLEEIIKDKDLEEIIKISDYKPPTRKEEVVRIGTPKTELEQITPVEEEVNGAKKEFLEIKKELGENHQVFVKAEKPRVEQFEEIGEANKEEDIIKVGEGKEHGVKEEEIHRHISPNLPSLAEYLEFVKTKRPLEQFPPASSGKFIEFIETNQKSGGRFDLETLNLCTPVLERYIEFMKTKQGSINLKSLGVCVPFIGDYIEFAKAKGEQKYVEFMKEKEAHEAIQENPRKYLGFKELPSLNAYIEFVKAKQGKEEINLKDLSLAEYIEFMKGKEGKEYIEFVRTKEEAHPRRDYVEFTKLKGKEDYLGFEEVPSSDKYVEFMKDFNQPEYLEFAKTNKHGKVTEPECEATTPEKYLNCKYLSLNAPSVNKYVEFMKSKQNSGKDSSPVEYVEFMKTPAHSYLNFKKLPYLDEYIEFVKAKNLSFSLFGYVEFMKERTPENYLSFMKSFPPEEYVEFMKAQQCPPSLDDYVEFMKAKHEVEKVGLEGQSNLKDLTLEDVSDMWKIVENLEHIKLKLDDLEKVKSCRCEPALRKLETPSGYEILTPASFRYHDGERDSPKRIFPHDVDDLSGQKTRGSPSIFDFILHPQIVPSSPSDVNTSCGCGRQLENGRCPSCAPYIKELNE